ncbi:unnamed protein product [Timema podura]|uniref:Uncharacterized protein n=1 Tax=Timema podura TaxID=61482 RepID=A0ABN7NGA4_TIMPD|nr:unnamed protein product [Timema podura]
MYWRLDVKVHKNTSHDISVRLLFFQNNVLHYITDGSAKLMFSFKRNLYFAPIIMILKSLLDVSDEFIFKQLTSGFEENLYFKGYVLSVEVGEISNA